MDNLSANVRGAKDYFPGQKMEAVYLPTEASWLNAIESEFTPLSTYAIKNSDDTDHLHRRRRSADDPLARHRAALGPGDRDGRDLLVHQPQERLR